jgi:ubiquinone/menaquinone biosynthesis C-methylase UbiE
MDQPKESLIQERYYEATASRYDEMHLGEGEHQLALHFLVGMLDHLRITSVLDIGSGTGRAVQFIKAQRPGIRVVGIEPVAALRQIALAKGLQAHEILDGDASHLTFADGEFDLVCEFGVLHHVQKPDLVVAEMLRVAGKAIFISDSNNFGQGSYLTRSLKQFINMLGLWKLANLIKTGGKGYSITEGDGLSWSYSVFNNYRQITDACSSVHLLNTTRAGINPYRSSPHVALLGIRQSE